MILYEDIPEELSQMRTAWLAKREEWLKRAEKAEGYYYNDIENTGTTYTVAQVEQVKKTTDIYPSINFLYPTTNQKQSILVQNRPSHKVISLNGSEESKKYAYLIDMFKNHILYISESVEQQTESVKDMLIMGQGIVGFFEKKNRELGDLGIEYKYIHPSTVILDANSREKTGTDMRGYFLEKEITRNDAIDLYGDIIQKINIKYNKELTIDHFAGGLFGQSSGRGKLPAVDLGTKYSSFYVSEYYYLMNTYMYNIQDPNGNIVKMFAENFDFEEETAVLSNAINAEYNRYLCKITILGDKIIKRDVLPIKNKFNIKVKYFEWGGSPYRSYGMIHYTMGMQDAYDKIIQMMLVNGMLTNNAGYIAPKGSIPEADKSKWELLGNKPGVIKEYSIVADISGNAIPPVREQIQGLSNFYPMVAEMLRSGIEYSTGIYPFIQGNPSESKIDVFSTLQQYTTAAMQRIQLALSHIQHCAEVEGNILIDLIIAKINPEETYILFDPENQQFNAMTIMQDMAKDFKIGRYKVLAIPSETTQTQRLSMATELMKVAQTTPDPIERSVYIKKAFSLSDMRGFDELQEEVNTAKQLQSQVQQLQSQLERSAELMKQWENKVINAELQLKIMQATYKAIDDVNTAKAETTKDLEIAKLQEQLKEAKAKDKEKE